MTLLQALLLLGPLVGYLLGSIPFGLLIGLGKGVDIRKVGSGNIGATNLGRTLGVRYFWYAFLLDALKGFAPTLTVSLLAWHGGLPAWIALLTALATLLGHIFPLYLKFKGGKGVATSFGVVLGVWPIFTQAGLAAGMVFLLVFMAYRYISLASIIGALSFVGFVVLVGVYQHQFQAPLWSDFRWLLTAAALLATLIIVKHRANIRRLVAGTEPRFGHKPKDPATPES